MEAWFFYAYTGGPNLRIGGRMSDLSEKYILANLAERESAQAMLEYQAALEQALIGRGMSQGQARSLIRELAGAGGGAPAEATYRALAGALPGEARGLLDRFIVGRQRFETAATDSFAALRDLTAKEPVGLINASRIIDRVDYVRRDVIEALRKINPTVDFETAMSVVKDGRVGGAAPYNPLQRVISLGLDLRAADPADAGYRGVWQSLEEVLSNRERAILVRRFPRMEDRAQAFADYARSLNRDGNSGAAEKVFGNVRRFFGRVGNAARLRGFESHEDLFDAALRGGFAERAKTRQGLFMAARVAGDERQEEVWRQSLAQASDTEVDLSRQATDEALRQVERRLSGLGVRVQALFRPMQYQALSEELAELKQGRRLIAAEMSRRSENRLAEEVKEEVVRRKTFSGPATVEEMRAANAAIAAPREPGRRRQVAAEKYLAAAEKMETTWAGLLLRVAPAGMHSAEERAEAMRAAAELPEARVFLAQRREVLRRSAGLAADPIAAGLARKAEEVQGVGGRFDEFVEQALIEGVNGGRGGAVRNRPSETRENETAVAVEYPAAQMTEEPSAPAVMQVEGRSATETVAAYIRSRRAAGRIWGELLTECGFDGVGDTKEEQRRRRLIVSRSPGSGRYDEVRQERDRLALEIEGKRELVPLVVAGGVSEKLLDVDIATAKKASARDAAIGAGKVSGAKPAPVKPAEAGWSEIKVDLLAIARRVNPHVEVQFADRLLMAGKAVMNSGALDESEREVAGQYDPARGIAAIALQSDRFDARATVYHELAHSLEGALVPGERAVLEAAFPTGDRLTHSEKVAYAFQAWALARENRAVPEGLWREIEARAGHRIAPEAAKAPSKMAAALSDDGALPAGVSAEAVDRGVNSAFSAMQLIMDDGAALLREKSAAEIDAIFEEMYAGRAAERIDASAGLVGRGAQASLGGDNSPNKFSHWLVDALPTVPKEELLPKDSSLADIFGAFEQQLLGRTFVTPVGLVVNFQEGHFFRLIAGGSGHGIRKGYIAGHDSAAEAIYAIRKNAVHASEISGFEFQRARRIGEVGALLTSPHMILLAGDAERHQLVFIRRVGGSNPNAVVMIGFDAKENRFAPLTFHPKTMTSSWLEKHRLVWLCPEMVNALPNDLQAETLGRVGKWQAPDPTSLDKLYPSIGGISIAEQNRPRGSLGAEFTGSGNERLAAPSVTIEAMAGTILSVRSAAVLGGMGFATWDEAVAAWAKDEAAFGASPIATPAVLAEISAMARTCPKISGVLAVEVLPVTGPADIRHFTIVPDGMLAGGDWLPGLAEAGEDEIAYGICEGGVWSGEVWGDDIDSVSATWQIAGDPAAVCDLLPHLVDTRPAEQASSLLKTSEMLSAVQAVADDVRGQLLRAGMAEEEAAVNAAVVAARYEARAAQMEGMAGNAWMLYQAEGIDIRSVSSSAETVRQPGSFEQARQEVVSTGPDGRTDRFDRHLQYWKESIGDLLKGNPRVLSIGVGVPVLHAMKVTDRNIELPGVVAAQVARKHPDIPLDVWEQLPELMADPLMVVPHRDGGVDVLMVVQTIRGEPILVGVRDGRVRTITPRNHEEGISGWDKLNDAIITTMNTQAEMHPGQPVMIYSREGKVPSEVFKALRGQFPAPALPSEKRLRPGTKLNILSRDDVIKSQGRIFYQVYPTVPDVDSQNDQQPGPLGTNSTFEQAAFHGSPHQFDRFDVEHVGRGEGSQSFGWGLYFASQKEVAEGYRNRLSSIRDIVDDKEWGQLSGRRLDLIGDGGRVESIDLSPEEAWVLEEARTAAPAPGNLRAGLNLIADDLVRRIDHGSAPETDRQRLRAATDLLSRTGVRGGRLYEVDIPDDGAYLLWDKPLSQQPEAVRAALLKVLVDIKGEGELRRMAAWKPPGWTDDPPDARYEDVVSAGTIYNSIAFHSGEWRGRETSEALLAAGVAGVKYLDGGSRAAGEGAYNYVVFDGGLVQIKTFHQPVPRGIGWTALAEDVNHFTEEVRRVLKDGPNRNARVRVGDTPLVLNLLEVPRKELRMTESKISSVLKDHPEMTPAQLGRAVALLADPVMVIRSGTRPGALVAVLEEVDANGDFLVAAIHPNDGEIAFHKFASMYGKEKVAGTSAGLGAQHWLDTAFESGDVLYLNSNKASALSRAARVTIPAVQKARGFNGSMLTERDLVKLQRRFSAFYQSLGGSDSPRSQKDSAITAGLDEETLRGRITIEQGRTVVSLLKNADRSTFLHEMSHLWLDELVRDAGRPEAPERLKAYLKTALDWFGVQSPGDITRAHHEQWARGFEAFIMEGRAPKAELEGAFGRFKNWLTDIYRSVAALDTPINDDIRQLMASMVGGKGAIKMGEASKVTTFSEAVPPSVALSGEQGGGPISAGQNQTLRLLTPVLGLRAALEAAKPDVAASYARIVRSTFDRMVADLGPSLKNVGNDWTWARVHRNTVALNLGREQIDRPDRPGRPDTRYFIDEERLSRNAAMFADAAVETWEGKIAGKLGELEDAEVRRMDGARFNITGSRDGRTVRIQQEMIINVSSQGKPFNQFPARIYVDGKFTSEKAYQKMFAAMPQTKTFEQATSGERQRFSAVAAPDVAKPPADLAALAPEMYAVEAGAVIGAIIRQDDGLLLAAGSGDHPSGPLELFDGASFEDIADVERQLVRFAEKLRQQTPRTFEQAARAEARVLRDAGSPDAVRGRLAEAREGGAPTRDGRMVASGTRWDTAAALAIPEGLPARQLTVLVTGGRGFSDGEAVRQVLDHIANTAGLARVVHGAAKGADSLANDYARDKGIDVAAHPAQWDRFGNAAGPRRNAEMLEQEKPDLVIAFSGGRGTADMTRRAREAGVPVLDVPLREQTREQTVLASLADEMPPPTVFHQAGEAMRDGDAVTAAGRRDFVYSPVPQTNGKVAVGSFDNARPEDPAVLLVVTEARSGETPMAGLLKFSGRGCVQAFALKTADLTTVEANAGEIYRETQRTPHNPWPALHHAGIISFESWTNMREARVADRPSLGHVEGVAASGIVPGLESGRENVDALAVYLRDIPLGRTVRSSEATVDHDAAKLRVQNRDTLRASLVKTLRAGHDARTNDDRHDFGWGEKAVKQAIAERNKTLPPFQAFREMRADLDAAADAGGVGRAGLRRLAAEARPFAEAVFKDPALWGAMLMEDRAAVVETVQMVGQKSGRQVKAQGAGIGD